MSEAIRERIEAMRTAEEVDWGEVEWLAELVLAQLPRQDSKTPATIKVKLVGFVDEKGNGYFMGWRNAKILLEDEDFDDMEEQARDNFDGCSFKSAQCAKRFITADISLPRTKSVRGEVDG